jgi:Alw26I/Eco31I/Esp3I family type II restriction m6 adenine DNA methyltransferase
VPAPEELASLVERFDLQYQHYLSPRYNETQLRVEFIDPLFMALGWDVSNRAGHAEAYKDVVHEYSLKIGGTYKAPDYSFRVGGVRTFFVEAKKPSVDILRDPDPAYQLRRYAWTAKLPISVLTNFRDLVLYDCTGQPQSSDSSSNSRALSIGFREYTDRWDELAELISKEGVLRGGLDRYAATANRRRGTIEVDDAFLSTMERWRYLLADNLAQHNHRLSLRDLNDSVQQIIDRIVFLRIAEDRGIEPYGQLRDLAKRPEAYDRYVTLFKRADTRYNSGLFHFRKDKLIEAPPDLLTPSLRIDDFVIQTIAREMYYPDSPYEFSVLSADILGHVYERFLGSVIYLTDAHHVKVDEKPEVKKAGGIYYTPTHITRRIVRDTVGSLLFGKTPTTARRLRIVDPACGSGSFLIEVYSYLMNWHLDFYLKQTTKVSKQRVFQTPSGEWRLTLEERKRILLDNIYGVDIDRQAVEVTKLSLLLRLLEGETDESVNAQFELIPKRMLPDLENNIKCGNSLLPPDVEDQLALSRDEIEDINPFDWNEEFPDILRAGGFDVVLGNPPYDVLEKDRSKTSWPHAIIHDYVGNRGGPLAEALGGKLNMYRFFVVRSLQLTRQQGRWGMIVPLSLMADVSVARTRKFLLANTTSLTADCFPQKDNPARRVFKQAKLSTVVVTATKSDGSIRAKASMSVRLHPGKDFEKTAVSSLVRVADLSLLDPDSWPVPLTSQEEWDLCRRIHILSHARRLGEVEDYIVTRGEINQTTYRKYIVSDSHCARLIKGVEIGPFKIHSTLSQGEQQWFDSYSYRRDYPTRTAPLSPRLAMQRITGIDEKRRVVVAMVDEAAYFADSTNSIVASGTGKYDLWYLAGLLNSKLMQWRFQITSSNNNVATNQLEALPIVLPDLNDEASRALHDTVCRCARDLTQLNSQLSFARSQEYVSMLRRVKWRWTQLEDAVSNLYALSNDDRKIVERRRPRAAETANLGS